MRRQPFILLSFSSSEKLRKAQETQSYQRIQCIGHTDFKGLSNAVTNTHSLLPSMGITRQKMVLAQSPTKWPTFAFTPENEYTLAFAQKIAHSGLHGETGAIQMGALLLPSDCFTRFRNPAWPGGRTANFAAFGSWSGALPENAESLRNSDALMCVAVPRRRGPAGLRDLFVSDEITVFTPCAQGFLRVRGGGGITTLGALYVLLKRRTAACQNGSFAVF